MVDHDPRGAGVTVRCRAMPAKFLVAKWCAERATGARYAGSPQGFADLVPPRRTSHLARAKVSCGSPSEKFEQALAGARNGHLHVLPLESFCGIEIGPGRRSELWVERHGRPKV